jgi:hypothetical protein
MMPEVLYEAGSAKLRSNQGNWYPANGGTETPFVSRSGRRLLYVYQPNTGQHAYLDCEVDIILSDEQAAAYLQLN